MTNITLRSVKGSPLTNDEVDSNFSSLNTFKVELSDSTGSALIPSGTTAQRDVSPSAGMFRYNTSLNQFEGYTTEWGPIAGALDSAAILALFSGGTGVTYTAATGTIAIGQDVSTSASPTFAGATVNGNITITGTVDGRDVAADGTKLDGIETGATADQTAAEILTAIKTVDGATSGLDADLLDGQHGSYYAPLASPALTGTPTAPTAVAGTNTTQIATTAFVGTAVSNLVASAPATLDTLNELAAALGDDPNFATTVTNSIATKLPLAGGTMTGSITFAAGQLFDGRDVSADGSKLDGIEAGATADQTASEILTAIKTVDGAASGLDADLLDGQQGSYYLNYSNFTNVPNVLDSADVLAMFSGGTGITFSSGAISTNDGEIVHDNLSGFIANEHIDHSTISITAGAGLTGGGTIAASRTLNVGAGTGITVNANDIAVNMAAFTTSNLSEGSNLYYTTARADSDAKNALTGGTGVTYTAATGTIAIGQSVATSASPTFAGVTVNGNITVTGTVDGRDIATDGTKLDGIEAGATADQTASEILTAIKTVDGATSGLDADLLDGQQGSYYLNYSNFTNAPNVLDSADVLAMFSGGTGITFSSGTIATNDAQIVHDNLSGFVANEHIDHSTVSISAGTGLTGGGTIAATRTLSIANTGVSAATYGDSSTIPRITVNAQGQITAVVGASVNIPAGYDATNFDSDFATKTTSDLTEGSNQYHTTARARGAISGGTGITYTSGTGVIATNDAAIVHDNLSGFVANEHIDHSTVSITAGNYLTGGGTIEATRTLNVDATSANTASKVVARDASGNFSAGTITATLSGNASTATALQTPRTIGGVSFDGTANINLPGVNTTGNQNTTGTAAGITGYSGTYWTSANDGSGTGLDADLLDGQQGSYYLDYNNFTNTPTAGITYVRKTTTYTAAVNDGVIADTSGGAWTLTLPASPSVGDKIAVADGADWSVNNLTVARNGSTIEGDAENMTMDIGGAHVTFIYDGTTWEIYTQIGAVGGSNVVNISNVWAMKDSAGTLLFAYNGVNKMKLDISGNLTVVGDVTTAGTI